MTNIDRGKLIIVPNENVENQEVFSRNIEIDKNHTYFIQEFSDMNMFGLQFEKDDYQTAACLMAEMGHLVIKMLEEGSITICYLPEVITEKQNNWLLNNTEFLSKFIMVNAFSLDYSEENEIVWKKLHGLNELIMESRKKMLREKGMNK